VLRVFAAPSYRPPVATRTCCLLSGLLGNRTMSLRLLEAVRAIAPGPVDELWLTDDTYRRHPAPKWLRISSELEFEHVAGRLLDSTGLPEASTYVVNTAGLAAVALRRRPGARWVVATDATPTLTDRLRARAYGVPESWVRGAFRKLQARRFRALAERVDLWLPMSRQCEDSLVEDFGVPRGRCLQTSAPQASIDEALPRRDPEARPFRLLFVGNDFARKGGMQLCTAIRSLPDVQLTIVSRDPEARRHASERILVRDDVTEPGSLARAYREAHLLVHPTFVDHYSHVICEGLARGLPFAVTAGTPPAELIERSGAGVAIAWPPSQESIAAALTRVMQEPARYAPLCGRALAFARRELDARVFRDRLSAVLGYGVTGPATAVVPS
jgi:glycosyltransferase involved in cell wall biosynthesis